MAKDERLVKFYLEEHNVHLPHTAFSGQTPDEMSFGRGEDIPEKLKKKRKEAQLGRLKRNRALSCGIHEEDIDAAWPSHGD